MLGALVVHFFLLIEKYIIHLNILNLVKGYAGTFKLIVEIVSISRIHPLKQIVRKNSQFVEMIIPIKHKNKIHFLMISIFMFMYTN